MPQRVEDRTSIDRTAVVRLIILLAIVIFAISGWLWWRDIYSSEQNVYWGMINNNLATTSVTRHVVQKNQSQTLDQYIQMNFGATNAAHSLITLTESDKTGKTVVKSETIGTPSTDYNRYLSIKTNQRNSKNQPIDTKNIIGLWAKSSRASAQSADSTGQYFNQSILSIVPFANLNPSARQSLIQFIKNHSVYIVAPNAKKDKYNGKSVYVYEVSVNPTAYVETMEEYAKDLGLGTLGLNASQYQGSPPLKIELTVDKLSRQLLKINYPTQGQEETFSSQGLEQQITLPNNTIPLSELQNRIQSSLQ